ncbi:MAG: hypothetical protein LC751_14720 [Actinobacteria bacterium]|nr:hypothetical protein [Actinomycetota bacterium]MCA1739671.1 hypothetical protein [Actinomycetota bacterium]
MLPDPDNPLFYVYAEADSSTNGSTNSSDKGSRDGSEGLVSEYAGLVEDIIKSE